MTNTRNARRSRHTMPKSTLLLLVLAAATVASFVHWTIQEPDRKEVRNGR